MILMTIFYVKLVIWILSGFLFFIFFWPVHPLRTGQKFSCHPS